MQVIELAVMTADFSDDGLAPVFHASDFVAELFKLVARVSNALGLVDAAAVFIPEKPGGTKTLEFL
jgi:hypothetical protein